MSTSEPATGTRAGVRRRVTAILLAVVLAVLVWVVAVPVVGLDLDPAAMPEPIGIGPVIGAALVAGLAGWGVSALLGRFVGPARTVWLVLSVVVALLSLSGPLTSGAHLPAVLVLALMHVVVAAVLIPGLAPRPTRAR